MLTDLAEQRLASFIKYTKNNSIFHILKESKDYNILKITVDKFHEAAKTFKLMKH